MKSGTPNPRHDGESGFVLLAAIVLVVLLLISLAIAAPKVAQSIQRDKELETIHRGEQYRLAIKLYYQKFGSYPTSIDQLLNTNNMRFLRQRYTDPMTGKDDWKPILFGHAHVRPLGFFGKPLSAVGGIAASGVVGGGMTPGMYAIEPASTDANGVPTGGTGSSDDTTGGTGSSWGSTSGFGSGNGGFGSGSSGFGSGSSLGSSGSSFGSGSSLGSSSSGFGSGSNLGSSSSGFGSSTSGFGSSGSGFGSSTSGFGSSSTTDGGSTLGSGFGSAGSTSGSTFGSNGVGPIVGFTLPVKKASLIDYMEQTAYNKWEFNYDPAADQLQQAVSLFGGGATMNNSSSGSTATGFGSNSSTNGSGSLFGSSSGFGSSGFGTSNSNSGTSNSGTQNGTNPPTTNPQSPDPNSPQQ